MNPWHPPTLWPVGQLSPRARAVPLKKMAAAAGRPIR
jgi:hypothetical protein